MADSACGDVIVRVLPADRARTGWVRLLQETERARASRFVHQRHAAVFVAGRAALRAFAADLAGVPPDTLTARYLCGICGDMSGDHGRPGYVLADGSAGPRVSLSRAGNWLVLAGAAQEQGLSGLGVDAELASRTDFAGFDAFLTGREASSLALFGPAAQPWQRARLWARKEAFVKALGVGLARDPASVDVTDNIVEGVQLTDLDSGLLGLPSGMVVALAVRSGPL